MAPTLTLHYFNFPARAGPIRAALHIGGVEFKDVRINFEEFGKKKSSYQFGTIPVLEVETEGKTTVLGQSNAALSYAGRLTGLYPSDPLDASRVDNILGAVEDLYGKIVASLFEKDAAKKEQLRKELADTKLPPYFKTLNSLLEQNKSGYFVGEDLTVADLKLYFFVAMITSDNFDYFPRNFLDQFELVKAWFERVREHPKFKEHANKY